MKKKIFALLAALVLLIGFMPEMVIHEAEAGSPITWKGGNNPSCSHEITSASCIYVNESIHKYVTTCPHCNASGTWTSGHSWKTSEITPGSTGFPNGGTIKYCEECNKYIEKPNGTSTHAQKACAHKHLKYVKETAERHRIVCKDCKKWIAHVRHEYVTKQNKRYVWEECRQCGRKRFRVKKTSLTEQNCTHPESSLVYKSNENGTHNVSCGECGTELGKDEACTLEKNYIMAADLSKELLEKYPNGAMQTRCTHCGYAIYTDVDDEPCPESPEGAPHLWTLWYPSDEGHCHRTCARCQLDVTEPHVWSEWESRGGLTHYRRCVHCRETQEGNHGNWTNITVTSPATCIENAKVDATCGICNARISNVSASLLSKEYLATGHDFENGPWHINGPATVSSAGAGGHYKSCAVCGVTDMENSVAHTWGAKAVIQAGECENPNNKRVEEATCTACGAKLHEETEVHHNQVRYPEGDIEATCEEFGKEAYKCTICNGIFGEAIQPLGHDMQEIEKKDATCETEGYIKRKCSRCEKEETEILEKKSTTGKHTWVPDIGKQPDCLEPGTVNGEVCSVCGARRTDGKYGVGIMPALGHKVMQSTKSVGRVREYVTSDGVTECTCYETVFYCGRCYAGLGKEYYTVATNPNISRYLIEPGKHVKITDLGNGIHIDGNMANDGGAYFNGEVQTEFGKVLDTAGKKYTYYKKPANSFIIEFTDEFLAEQEDGDYELIVINGNEYWPMTVTVTDHLFTEIKPVAYDGDDAPEWTMDDYNAWAEGIRSEGGEVKELYMGCIDR